VPELPEVETVVRDLRPRLLGKRINRLRVGKLTLRRPWKRLWADWLVGQRIVDINRRGKWIIIRFENGSFLVIHLGMTGQLGVATAHAVLAPHTHMILDIAGTREQLRFRDVRRFGSATVFGSSEQLEEHFRKVGLGPEPFRLDLKYWQGKLATTERNLKAVLLDQRIVAGIGNIYADEALFEACLHPRRRGCDLSVAEASGLRKAIGLVLRRAINRRGSSIRDFVDGSGRQGSYQREFRVYQSVGQACPRCHTPIERIRLSGRSTHFCPCCQSLKVRRRQTPKSKARQHS
jgi:formamidopyrimidine-DNA glycosylase